MTRLSYNKAKHNRLLDQYTLVFVILSNHDRGSADLFSEALAGEVVAYVVGD